MNWQNVFGMLGSKQALQFLPSIDSKAAIALTQNKKLDMVVFTGSTNTALSIIKSNPKLKLLLRLVEKMLQLPPDFVIAIC